MAFRKGYLGSRDSLKTATLNVHEHAREENIQSGRKYMITELELRRLTHSR